MNNQTSTPILGAKTVLYEGNHLRFVSQERVCNGKKHVREAVERKNSTDIVIILALTENDEVVLERSFRVPMNTYVRELPAGLVDVQGELPKETAKRELLEETGYTSNDIIYIGYCPIDQGIINTRAHCYLFRNVKKTNNQKLEEGEFLETYLIPKKKIKSFLQEKINSGELVDMKIYALLAFVD